VVYSLVGVIIVYLIASRTLNKGASLVDFLRLSREDTPNVFGNWLVIGITYVFIFSVFFSQYIPIVPRFVVENVRFHDYTLNKFGFLFVSLLCFYGVKGLLCYIFFKCSLSMKYWKYYIFHINKFFSLVIVLTCILTILEYFYPIDRFIAFDYYVYIFIGIGMGKIAYLLFNRHPTFPKEWYYKFLYLCTLQILPYFVIGKILFF